MFLCTLSVNLLINKQFTQWQNVKVAITQLAMELQLLNFSIIQFMKKNLSNSLTKHCNCHNYKIILFSLSVKSRK